MSARGVGGVVVGSGVRIPPVALNTTEAGTGTMPVTSASVLVTATSQVFTAAAFVNVTVTGCGTPSESKRSIVVATVAPVASLESRLPRKVAAAVSCAFTGCPEGMRIEAIGNEVSIGPTASAFQPCTLNPFVGLTSSPVEETPKAPSRV